MYYVPCQYCGELQERKNNIKKATCPACAVLANREHSAMVYKAKKKATQPKEKAPRYAKCCWCGEHIRKNMGDYCPECRKLYNQGALPIYWFPLLATV